MSSGSIKYFHHPFFPPVLLWYNWHMPTLGARIRQARFDSQLSLVAMGKAIGLSEGSVRGYEADRVVPPLPSLRAIAQATGKPLSYFTEEVSPEGPEDIQEVIRQIQWAIPALLKAQGIQVQRGEEYAGIRELLDDHALCGSLQVTEEERVLLLAGYTGPVGLATKHEAVKLLQTLRDMTARRGVQVDRDDRVA